MKISPREAAYLALLASLREQKFIAHSLEEWKWNERVSSLDYAFAFEIASGTARMALSLDFMAAQLATHEKLSLKQKEKALLRTAIYQHCFMGKVPLYAIVNETIELAKKYCHRTFANFLNALLRKLADGVLALPQGNSISDLSIRYSYPPFFVEKLINDYEIEIAVNIMKAGNKPSSTMARVREQLQEKALELRKITDLHKEFVEVVELKNSNQIGDIAASPNFYIQNVTPAVLIADLAQHVKTPSKILDLCASPGGKLLSVHDLFPEAKLFANDVSEEKLSRMKENLLKYNVEANLTCGLGQEYVADAHFDIVILDVPCSNAGVLNKRPEARWRLDKTTLHELKEKQWSLLKHATTLITKTGCIWYLTCSILKEENELLLAEFCKQFSMQIVYMRTILPNTDGWDGGFACMLTPTA